MLSPLLIYYFIVLILYTILSYMSTFSTLFYFFEKIAAIFLTVLHNYFHLILDFLPKFSQIY